VKLIVWLVLWFVVWCLREKARAWNVTHDCSNKIRHVEFYKTKESSNDNSDWPYDSTGRSCYCRLRNLLEVARKFVVCTSYSTVERVLLHLKTHLVEQLGALEGRRYLGCSSYPMYLDMYYIYSV
jgi:hypothetical protein